MINAEIDTQFSALLSTVVAENEDGRELVRLEPFFAAIGNGMNEYARYRRGEGGGDGGMKSIIS